MTNEMPIISQLRTTGWAF